MANMTTKSTTAIKERVEAGAAWLDRVDPTWIDRINLKGLDLADACGCVLGQIVSNKTGDEDLSYYDCVEPMDPYGTYEGLAVKKAELPRGTKRLAITHAQAVERGFHRNESLNPESDGSAEWKGLTSAWKRLIKARRDAK